MVAAHLSYLIPSFLCGLQLYNTGGRYEELREGPQQRTVLVRSAVHREPHRSKCLLLPAVVVAAHHRTHHAAAAAVTKGVLGARQAVAPRRHRGARLGG